MAGLIDWLTEGIGGAMGGAGGLGSLSTPPPSSTPPDPTAAQPPPAAAPPVAPGPDAAGAQPPPAVGMTPSSVPAPIPTMARPPEPPPAAPLPSDAAAPPPGPPMSLAPPAPGPSAPPPNPNGFVPPATGPSWAPDQQGRGGLLANALGLSPDQANRLRAGVGAGMTAAGNSAGKSPFQALASGAGATMEGASKEQHQNTKDAQGYLDKALAAQKAGDEATYKTNYMQYLQADLKNSQEKAASATAANKNDSPTQLYLAAQRNVAADPMVHGAMESYKNALKNGSPQEQAAAKAALDQTTQERQAAHLAGVGLHPQTAAEVAKQPGMTQANPLDAGAAGITPQNIGKKLQPGQYYTNPTDGKVYQFKGAPSSGSESVTPSVTKPKSADPLKPSKTKTPAAADEEDD